MKVAEERNKKWAILCSGWGNNARDVIEATSNSTLKNINISLLIYDETPCGAAQMAEHHNIEALQISRSDFPEIESHQRKLIDEITKREIDFIFLLNYKYLIRKEMLNAFPNRILNVHPSLFPSFLGTKTAIQDALEYGVKITGITTHIIDHNYDRGIILCQEVIRINKKDTFDTLYPNFRKKGLKIILKTITMIQNKENELNEK
tara:strand:- start:404 stop:1018 length:615 start_codon:yes stop_codon:yes gene_type:complete